MKYILVVLLTFVLAGCASNDDSGAINCYARGIWGAGEPIFDSQSFQGWEGNLDAFRIEDGAIVGGSLTEHVPRNEFLATTKRYSDFDLSISFKLLGEGANAGIQFRTERIPNHHEVIGYQADMGQQYWGSLYDESRRKKIIAQADFEAVSKIIKHNDWNTYQIRCEGPRVRMWLNGVQTVDYIEPDDSIPRDGIIALQIHSGPPTEAWYKDITIMELN
jgi:hypothetical protein